MWSLQQLSEFLRWFHPAERLSRPVVEPMSHSIEMTLTMDREVRAPWEVLPEQTVGILVRAALPGALRVAEVHLHAGGNAKLSVAGHLLPAVPCQGHREVLRERPDLLGDERADASAGPVTADGQ